MKDLGCLHYFLCIAVSHSNDAIFLLQKKYAEEILERAGMSQCKPSLTPVDTKRKLSSKTSKPCSDSTKYRQLAGALQYLTFT